MIRPTILNFTKREIQAWQLRPHYNPFMNQRLSLRPILILGPTAGGKSDLAVQLALALHELGEPLPQILGADSMQVYRHMDAGTAKPSPALRQQVPHHLIDLLEPTQRFTVHDWLTQCESLLAQLAEQQTRAIIVGGTNLYIKAFLEGLFTRDPGIPESPQATSSVDASYDPTLRAQLEQLDNQTMHDQLARVDPASAQRIHRNDRKKMIRALEVFTLTGSPISARQTQWDQHYQAYKNQPSANAVNTDLPAPQPTAEYRHQPILIGLHWPTELINRRINARVKEMFYPRACGRDDESLPDETARLEQAGLLGPQARLALGYKQVLEHLAGRCTLDDAFEQTKIQTRRFAKQQRTWLKRYQGVHWLPAGETELRAWVERSVQIISGC